ncbi:xanthine phosphoribosyltransferase [Haloimpatiens sp. FM7330]|uniref:xanthine phosphoribosyltransferase n=1 Tax=Haloimpatiens sp. FM7330 TaxID=3298610 RepID=UPI00363A9F69
MEKLKQKILKDGQVIENRILKVDNFLNHKIDIQLFNDIGKEFKKRFQNKEVTKILTAEVSGIAIAAITAQYFDNVPVVFAKKHDASNLNSNTYESEVYSFTKNKTYKLRVDKNYISCEDKVLIIDDFLASGSAASALIDILYKSKAEIVGMGIVIEKNFQGGRKLVEEKGVKLESLAIIDSFEDGVVKFVK